MPKVVTFGEIMLRLSPPGFERFLQTSQFVATFGGGEANVAVSLAQFGVESWYVTRLPAHAIGDAAVKALRAEGVHTEAILRGGDRIGVYYAESGASQRASVVIYDRARSAISEMDPASVDWDATFRGATWFHVTGITPALGVKAATATVDAIAAARAAGARVSVDLNFRRKLWTEAEAQQVMRPLVPRHQSRHRQRRGSAGDARHRGQRRARRRRSARRAGLSRRGRTRLDGSRRQGGRDHAPRKPVGER